MDSRVSAEDEAQILRCFAQAEEEINVSRLKRRAKEHLIELAYRRYYRQMIVEKDSSELPNDLQIALKDLPRSMFGPPPPPAVPTKYWICINPKEAPPKQLFKAMTRCVNKAMLKAKAYHWAMEQRAVDGEDPRGWHFHWLVDFETPRYKGVYLQQVYQAFKRYLPDEVQDPSKQSIQFYEIHDQAGWDNRLSYISGTKKGNAEEKMPKVEYDHKLRDALGIPHLISYP